MSLPQNGVYNPDSSPKNEIRCGDFREIISDDGAKRYQHTKDDGQTWDDISSVDKYGNMYVNELESSLGSLSLGGLHCIGSSGEKIVVLNTKSGMLSVFVAQTLAADGSFVGEPQYLEFGDKTSYRSGDIDVNSVECDAVFCIPTAYAHFSLRFAPREKYKGRLTLRVTDLDSQKFVVENTADMYVDAADLYSFPVKYWFFADANQKVRLELIKEDGTHLKLNGITADKVTPYMEFKVRTWKFVSVKQDLSGFVTAEQFQTVVEQLDKQIDDIKDNYITKVESDAAITAALAGYVKKTELDYALEHYATDEELSEAIKKVLEDIKGTYATMEEVNAAIGGMFTGYLWASGCIKSSKTYSASEYLAWDYMTGNIPYDSSKGTFTLDGERYFLFVTAQFNKFSNATGGYIVCQWLNADTNAALSSGNKLTALPASYTGQDGNNPTCAMVYDSAKGKKIKFAKCGGNGSCTIQGSENSVVLLRLPVKNPVNP